mmetsp:Transcript_36009/g.57822  ORF Transcript_36009/g.57822 Transcript_36009/m.57822 type:complete len:217 (+) Transcript_36009:311-961(+)
MIIIIILSKCVSTSDVVCIIDRDGIPPTPAPIRVLFDVKNEFNASNPDLKSSKDIVPVRNLRIEAVSKSSGFPTPIMDAISDIEGDLSRTPFSIVPTASGSLFSSESKFFMSSLSLASFEISSQVRSPAATASPTSVRFSFAKLLRNFLTPLMVVLCSNSFFLCSGSVICSSMMHVKCLTRISSAFSRTLATVPQPLNSLASTFRSNTRGATFWKS